MFFNSEMSKHKKQHLIGASLSEPHTSVTVLQKCVCSLLCMVSTEVLFFRHHSTLQIKYISIFEPKAGISTLYGFSSEGEMLPVGSYKWGF